MSYKEIYYTYPSGGSKRASDYRKKALAGSKTSIPNTSVSKKSANYNRIIPANSINYKSNIRIPYKNELLKQMNNNKGSKSLNDYIKNRNTKESVNEEIMDPAFDKELVEKVENTEAPTTQLNEKTNSEALTSEQKDLIDKILSADTKNEPKQVIPKVTVKTIKTVADINKKAEANVDIHMKKINELESYISQLTIEIDKLKNNQKHIVRAVNRLLKNGSASKK